MNGEQNNGSTLPASLERAELFDRIEAYQEFGDIIHMDDLQGVNRCLDAYLYYGADPLQSFEEQVNFLSLCLVLQGQSLLRLSTEEAGLVSNILKYLQSHAVVSAEITAGAESVNAVMDGTKG
jgi:hypothetical protein